VGRNEAGDIDAFTRDLAAFTRPTACTSTPCCTAAWQAGALDELLITPLLDRPLAEISPIERGVLWIGAYEFQHCLDVPWRVVLNECIELAKSFGGTDGHKYVNGVLHQLAAQLRPVEVAADGQKQRAKPSIRWPCRLRPTAA
jgi:transcription antitermination protein NusB